MEAKRSVHVTVVLDSKGNAISPMANHRLNPLWNWRAVPLPDKDTAVVKTVLANPELQHLDVPTQELCSPDVLEAVSIESLNDIGKDYNVLDVIGDTRRWKELDPTHLTVYAPSKDGERLDVWKALGLDPEEWERAEHPGGIREHHWSCATLPDGAEDYRWVTCVTVHRKGRRPAPYLYKGTFPSMMK